MIENGDLILNYLERLGVEYVFGVPGGSIEPFYNALARSERRGGPKAILARHETGAAFMADGYARATGKLGVCCATSGPGATNMLTGVANAYADEIPILVITAQPAIERFGLGAFQEGSCTGINTLSIFESCTRFNTLVSHSAQLEPKLVQAISFAKSRHPGPVHLSIPIDIMKTKVKDRGLRTGMRAFINHDTMPSLNGQKLVMRTLAGVKKATVVIGPGCRSAIQEIIDLVEARRWLMVTTPMAKGLVPYTHPQYRGVFGLGGHQSARDALLEQNAEKVLVIGTALDEVTTGGWDDKAVLSERLIHISENPEHLSRSIMAQVSVLGSPAGILQPFMDYARLNARPPKMLPASDDNGFNINVSYQDMATCLDQGHPVKPQSLFWRLGQWVPNDANILMDTGNSFLWGIHYWQGGDQNGFIKQPVYIGMGFATMGWAIGAAVGMAFAAPEKRIVCFTGDGSLLMSGQEITVAQSYGLNILFVVLNDAHLGMIRHGQKLGGAESIGNQLPAVDFALMARSMGISSYRINTVQQLEQIDVKGICATAGPCLLDVVIDAEEVPPMSSRIDVLSGKTVGETKHVVA